MKCWPKLVSKSFEPACRHRAIFASAGHFPVARMLELAGQFDAYLCGDSDAMTRAVIAKSLPRLKVISKYGIGLDKIDLKAATDLKVPVLFTPGVNHTTVLLHFLPNARGGAQSCRRGQSHRCRAAGRVSLEMKSAR